MTYLDIVKNWLSLTEHKDDIDKTTDDFINAYINEYGETNDRVTEFYDTELLNIKPTIDKNGNAILMINYYDIDFSVNSTIFCNKVEIVK